jgi:hypothetical protein
VIPYFRVEGVALGPMTLQAFGLCVLLGWLLALGAGLSLAARRGARPGVVALVLGLALPVLGVGGLLLQRVALPWPGGWLLAPLLLGMAALLAWLTDRPALGAQLEALVFGGLTGCAIYHLGSFLVHDRPGAVTTSPLGVQGICAGAGAACHDLGLYQMLGCAALAALVLGLGPRAGVGAALGLGGYGLLCLLLVPLADPATSSVASGLGYGAMFVVLGLLCGLTALIVSGRLPPAPAGSAAGS